MSALSNSRQYQLLKELESRELAENSLYEFVKQAWNEIEGGQSFEDGWHIKAMCDHAQACIERTIQFLCINVPPRSCKSTILSISLCAWAWIKRPHERFFYVSHSGDISREHSIKCRRLIESEWYQSRWGDRFILVHDQNTLTKFENDKSGYRTASSTNSRATGKGGSILVMDDPNDTNESDLERENTNNFVDQTWSTRINDRKTGCKIIVQQRSHEQDVTGHLVKEKEGWIHLMLPLEFETSRKCKTVVLPCSNGKIWEDPRQIEGELMWPTRWGAQQLKEMKNELKTQYRISGQLQQRPAPEEGGLLKRSYYKIWKFHRPPHLIQVIQSWDTALNEKKSNCYSACTTWGTFQDQNGVYNLLLLSLFRGRLEYPELRAMAQRLYYDYRDDNTSINIKPDGNHVPDMVIVENKSSGGSLIQELNRAGIPAIGFNPDKHGDKIARVRKISHFIERGQVWLPADPPDYRKLRTFADIFINQAALFPAGESRDLIDTQAQVLLRLSEDGWLINPKYDGDYARDTSVRSPLQAFY